MNGLLLGAFRGAAAGAAGTTVLNTATYLDMAVRARGASSTPEDTVVKLSEMAGLQIPGEKEDRQNRIAGLAPLAGILSGVGMGALLGVVRATGLRGGMLRGAGSATLLALVGTNGPMTALGITDPRTWTLSDWVSDVVPHLAYGAVTAGVLHGLDRPT
jgi:hypothetical protein